MWKSIRPSCLSVGIRFDNGQRRLATRDNSATRRPEDIATTVVAPSAETNNVVIRLADHKDATAISDLLARSFAEYEYLYTTDAFRVTIAPTELVNARMNEGPVWVALLDSLPVGTASVVISSSGCYIRGMAVAPAARGRQIGRKLLERIEEFAREQAVVRLYLSTTPFLHRAISLYERCGFVRTDGGPHDLHGTPLFTMEKLLTEETSARTT